MTINTKLASEIVNEWLCSPEPDVERKNALEKDGDSEKREYFFSFLLRSQVIQRLENHLLPTSISVRRR